MEFQIVLPLLAWMAGSACLQSNDLHAQSTIPPNNGNPSSPPNGGTYDQRNPSNYYNSGTPVPDQPIQPNIPNNQSLNGQPDRPLNQNTNPVRPDPNNGGLDPNGSRILNPTSPDPNGNKQVSPTGSGTINPSQKDSVPRELPHRLKK
ncbi:MAG TPA: hypothetical protein VGO45_07870 [Bacteroidia bacterium]|jgi:hypothetical protein|nr:hypothetical protein [Bacteroidia bacterium]